MDMVKILISGEIGWEVTPEGISEQLDKAAGKDLDVHIASPGGGVLDGIVIYNLFRDYKRKYPESQMMATIKGIAASMATYLAVNPAFDLLAAEDNAVFMIHNVWGMSVGDYREMLKTAEIFQGLTGIIAKAYTEKTGIKDNDIRKMMDDESWFFGSEILDSGFVDEIIKTDEDGDKIQAVAQAKLKFKDLSAKLKVDNSQTQKIAAMIKPDETQEPKKTDQKFGENSAINSPERFRINNAQNPANAGNNITEVQTMTLNELMAANPAAKIELDNMLDSKYQAGIEKGKEDVLNVSKKAAVFAKNEEYHKTIRSYAVDVMSGEKSMESLDALIVHADMIKEVSASDAAKNESEEIGATHGEQEPPTSKDGTISNPNDFIAEIARMKNSSGVEVR